MPLSKEELGKLVKKARKIKSESLNRKFTQKDLATAVGKSRSYIGDVESGRTYPSFVLLNEIAIACGISLDFFEDENQLNSDIDKFIRAQITDISDEEVISTREAIKKNKEAKFNHIYDYLKESEEESQVHEEVIIPVEYSSKYKVTSIDKKQYLESMKKATEAFFMNDEFDDEDKKEILDTMTEIFWKAKALNKRKPKDK